MLFQLIPITRGNPSQYTPVALQQSICRVDQIEGLLVGIPSPKAKLIISGLEMGLGLAQALKLSLSSTSLG